MGASKTLFGLIRLFGTLIYPGRNSIRRPEIVTLIIAIGETEIRHLLRVPPINR